jgi:hypothetical protein
MRVVPLREAPRNYLLTPSMVKEPEAERRPRARRGWTLPFMRLATALSAAAFVVVVGLQLAVGGMFMGASPASAPQAEAVRDEAPEAAMMEAPQEEEAVEAEEAEEEEAPLAAMVDTPEAAPTAVPPAWDEGVGGGVGGAPPGLGGGEEPLPPTPKEPVGVCVADAEEDCPDVELAETEPITRGETVTVSEVSPLPEEGPEVQDEPIAEEEGRAPWREGVVSPLLPVILGASTLVLGVLTWWLSRRRS